MLWTCNTGVTTSCMGRGGYDAYVILEHPGIRDSRSWCENQRPKTREQKTTAWRWYTTKLAYKFYYHERFLYSKSLSNGKIWYWCNSGQYQTGDTHDFYTSPLVVACPSWRSVFSFWSKLNPARSTITPCPSDASNCSPCSLVSLSWVPLVVLAVGKDSLVCPGNSPHFQEYSLFTTVLDLPSGPRVLTRTGFHVLFAGPCRLHTPST